MRLLVFLVILTLPAADVRSDDSKHEPTVASSQTLHVAAGIATSLVSGSTAFAVRSAGGADTDRDTRVRTAAWALGTSVLVGILKEGADAAGFGDPSGRDLLLTSLGGVAGTAALLWFLRSPAYASPSPASGSPLNASVGIAGAGLLLALPVVGELWRRVQQ